MGSELSTAPRNALKRARLVALAASMAVAASGVLTLAAPSQAWAKPSNPQAAGHYEEGLELFSAGDYEGAAASLEKAFAIEEDWVIAYAWAQAEFNQGDCAATVRIYKKVLGMAEVNEDARAAAQEAINYCAEQLADNQADPTAPPPVQEREMGDPTEPEVIESPSPQPEDEKPARKWYLDPLGDTLVAVGVVGVGVGAGLLIGAQVEATQGSSSYSAHGDRVDRVDRFRIGGAVALGVGGALIIGGAVRWGILASRSKSDAQAIRIVPTGRGLAITGRF